MSLKIITIQSATDNLTVDNNIMTVDNTIITVDMTLLELPEYVLRIPYRKYSPLVKLYLWNEITETETVIDITVVPEPGLMFLSFTHQFYDNDSYEATVKDSVTGTLIWRGKLLATTQTDLENFKLHTIVNTDIYKI